MELEDLHKKIRHERLNNKIYGKIQAPVLNKGETVLNPQPTYLQSRQTAKKIGMRMFKDAELKVESILDTRCFYTGVRSYRGSVPENGNHSVMVTPWFGTKDHIVPARRGVKNCPVDVSKYESSMVWCSNTANVTLGLVPLPIRLKIRQWLSTAQYDKDDTSIEAGHNIRWLIIDMLQDFRIKGKLIWSRKANGGWWYPEISTPLMNKWWQMELEFLALTDEQRNDWIENFVYHF